MPPQYAPFARSGPDAFGMSKNSPLTSDSGKAALVTWIRVAADALRPDAGDGKEFFTDAGFRHNTGRSEAAAISSSCKRCRNPRTVQQIRGGWPTIPGAAVESGHF